MRSPGGWRLYLDGVLGGRCGSPSAYSTIAGLNSGPVRAFMCQQTELEFNMFKPLILSLMIVLAAGCGGSGGKSTQGELNSVFSFNGFQDADFEPSLYDLSLKVKNDRMTGSGALMGHMNGYNQLSTTATILQLGDKKVAIGKLEFRNENGSQGQNEYLGFFSVDRCDQIHKFIMLELSTKSLKRMQTANNDLWISTLDRELPGVVMSFVSRDYDASSCTVPETGSLFDPVAVAHAWTKAINEQDLVAYEAILAPTIRYYKTSIPSRSAASQKSKSLSQSPGYTQKIEGISQRPLSKGRRELIFTKVYTIGGISKSISAILVVELDFEHGWKIVVESDAPTEARR
jgi:hypothetical protein